MIGMRKMLLFTAAFTLGMANSTPAQNSSFSLVARARSQAMNDWYPAAAPLNKKLADFSSDDDDGIAINLAGATSLHVDVGYTKFTPDVAKRLPLTWIIIRTLE